MCRFRRPQCVAAGTKGALLRAILVATASWALAGCRKTDDPSRQVQVDESKVEEIDWFHTGAWDDVPNFVGTLFRYVDESREDFVIVPRFATPAEEVPVDVVYRYSAREERFEPVGREDWDKATGPEWMVYEQYKWTGDTKVRFDRPFGVYGTLYLGESEFETAGWAVLMAVVSPAGEFVAAGSAAGKERPSIYGARTPEGPYYLEIFKTGGMRRVGPIYRFKRYGGKKRLWWTPDGRYVLSGRTHILVVPVFKLVAKK